MTDIKSLNYKILSEGYVPRRMHDSDAGFDLFLPHSIVLKPRVVHCISLQVCVFLETGTCGLILPRSSVSASGILVHTGVIDAGYTGTLRATVQNLTNIDLSFGRGMRIAQLVVLPLVPLAGCEAYSLVPKTDRGDSGFGSTGR